MSVAIRGRTRARSVALDFGVAMCTPSCAYTGARQCRSTTRRRSKCTRTRLSTLHRPTGHRDFV